MKRTAIFLGSMALKHFGPIVIDKAKEYAPMLLDDMVKWGKQTASKVGAEFSDGAQRFAKTASIAANEWVERKMSGNLGGHSKIDEAMLRHNGINGPSSGSMGGLA